jgi:hypothetical protein
MNYTIINRVSQNPSATNIIPPLDLILKQLHLTHFIIKYALNFYLTNILNAIVVITFLIKITYTCMVFLNPAAFPAHCNSLRISAVTYKS